MFENVITYNLDCIAFALLSVVAMAVVHVRLRRAGVRGVGTTRAVRPSIWLMLILLVMAGVSLSHLSDRDERDRLTAMVSGIAPTYALGMKQAGHSSLSLDTAPDDPTYLRLIELQRAWLRTNPGVSDIYTMRQTQDGTIVFFVDSETDYNRNGVYDGDREMRTRIGEPSELDDPHIEQAFAGVAGFQSTPMTDRWGTWVSAYVPIRDERGRVHAILGVDYNAAAWLRSIVYRRATPLGMTSVLVVILISTTAVTSTMRSEIGRRKQVEVSLEEARRVAEVASNAKSQFLAHMSHEIRTPLNGVIGMTDLLGRESLTGRQAHYVHVARSSAESLLALVNDILDFSKIEAGKMELSPVVFRLDACVDDVVHLLGHRATDKGLTLSKFIDPALPPVFEADAGRLRQVLINLINNAIKFTTRGRVDVRVSPVPQALGADDMLVRFDVTDTGIGIAPDRMDRLFKSFSQVDASTSRTYGGTGLGLAICQELSKLMGGSVGVNSEQGAGSTFWFTARLRVASPERLPRTVGGDQSREVPRFATTQDVRVLVAEDNTVNQMVVTEYLTRVGLAYDVVGDGEAAVLAVKSGRYALVLMDCQMPRMDGLEATRRIREAEGRAPVSKLGASRLPIIALTANTSARERGPCMEAGMDDFLNKPFQPDDLFGVLQKYLPVQPIEEASLEAEIDTAPVDDALLPGVQIHTDALPAEACESDDTEATRVWQESLRVRCAGNTQLIEKLLNVYLKQSDADLETIRRHALMGEMEVVRMSAHSWRGSAGHLGAKRLMEVTGQIEELARAGATTEVEQKLDELSQEAALFRVRVEQTLETDSTDTLTGTGMSTPSGGLLK